MLIQYVGNKPRQIEVGGTARLFTPGAVRSVRDDVAEKLIAEGDFRPAPDPVESPPPVEGHNQRLGPKPPDPAPEPAASEPSIAEEE
jgi:hypothetical protein